MSNKNNTVTRQDLAHALYREVGLSHTENKHLVERIFGIIADELANGETVKLAKFGTFSVRQKKERLGRNPKTGEVVPIEARTVLTFKPSSKLLDRVNNQKSKTNLDSVFIASQ